MSNGTIHATSAAGLRQPRRAGQRQRSADVKEGCGALLLKKCAQVYVNGAAYAQKIEGGI